MSQGYTRSPPLPFASLGSSLSAMDSDLRQRTFSYPSFAALTHFSLIKILPGINTSLTFSKQSTAQLIESLNTHRINTLTELCRIERVAASASDEDAMAFQGPMTQAWTYYVTSNNLLSELRGLTRNYPFSSEALDDAKWRVSNDPESNRSWNYAWLVLVKMRDE